MTVLFLLQLYLLTLFVFLVVDLLWLGLVARGFYRERLSHVLSPRVNRPAAVVFYLLYVAGILYYAVVPGLVEGSLRTAVTQAALFGFFTYMTYELTNLATVARWPLRVVIVDTLWGVLLCVAVSAAGFRVGQWLS